MSPGGVAPYLDYEEKISRHLVTSNREHVSAATTTTAASFYIWLINNSHHCSYERPDNERRTMSTVCFGEQGGETEVRVILNVGGQRHETFLTTLENFPDTRLSCISEYLRKNPSRDREFFFDRHPDLFAHVLNYFRTGKLHVPRDICGPMFEQELAFWGIDSKQIEHCCWAYYDEYNELEKTWEELSGPLPYDATSDGGEENELTLRCFRQRIWRVLEDPYSSKIAWVSLYKTRRNESPPGIAHATA